MSGAVGSLGPRARAAIQGRVPDNRGHGLSLEEENERLRVLLMAARQASQRRLERANRANATSANKGFELARQGRYIEAQRLALDDAGLALELLDIDVDMARRVLAEALGRLAEYRATLRTSR